MTDHPVCESRESTEEILKDMEVIDEYISDPKCDDQNDVEIPAVIEQTSYGPQESVEKEQTSCGPKEPVEKEQTSCGPQESVEKELSCGSQEPIEKEQTSCRPQEFVEKEQTSCGPKEPVEKEQTLCGPQESVEKVQISCGSQEPVEKEQTSCGPQESVENEQISYGSQEPVEKEQTSCASKETSEKEQPSLESQESVEKEQISCGLQGPMEKDQCAPLDAEVEIGLGDAETTRGSQSPNDSIEMQDSVLQHSITSANDLNQQRRRGKRGKKRRYSSISDEDNQSDNQYSITSADGFNQPDNGSKKRRYSPSSEEGKLSETRLSITSADGLNIKQNFPGKRGKRRHSSSSDDDSPRENYARLLFIMLNKNLRPGEPIKDYFYAKMYLLNKCGIGGRRAVDCLLYALGDIPLRQLAEAKQFRNPEDLLEFCHTAPYEFIKKKKAKGSKGKNCYNCKEQGHKNMDCPQHLTCKYCQKIGHESEVCRSKPKLNIDSKTCFFCKQIGHLISSCPKKPNNTKIKICKFCGKFDHPSNQCWFKPKPEFKSKTQIRNGTCYNCKEIGHTKAVCPKPIVVCDYCHKDGHLVDTCKIFPMNVPMNQSSKSSDQVTSQGNKPSPWVWS